MPLENLPQSGKLKRALRTFRAFVLLGVTTLGIGSARAEIIYQAVDLSAADSQFISFRFDQPSGVITTQIGDMSYPPTYGTLTGNLDIMSGGGQYFLGEGWSSSSGYGATTTAQTAGTTVGAGSTWTAQVQSTSAASGVYYGLRIDQGSGNFTYGWAQVSFGANGDGSTTLTAIAFERTLNQAIDIAAVPEPAYALVPVLLGFVACARWRKARGAGRA
jgi:hypothetical protein